MSSDDDIEDNEFDEEPNIQDPHYPKQPVRTYVPNVGNIKLAVKGILLKRKRDKKSIDRILFKQQFKYQSKAEQKEVERDRSDYIKFLIQKNKNTYPSELTTPYSKQNRKNIKQITRLSVIQKNIAKQLKPKKKTQKTKGKQEDSDEEEKNQEIMEVDDIEYNELYNNKSQEEDEIYQSDKGDYDD